MKKFFALIVVYFFVRVVLGGPNISAGWEQFPKAMTEQACTKIMLSLAERSGLFSAVELTESGNIIAESRQTTLLIICDTSINKVILSVGTSRQVDVADNIIALMSDRFRNY